MTHQRDVAVAPARRAGTPRNAGSERPARRPDGRYSTTRATPIRPQQAPTSATGAPANSTPPGPIGEIMDDNEAAALLRFVSVHTLRDWRRKGAGPPCHRLAGLGTGRRSRVLYLREELLAWVRECGANPKPMEVVDAI